MQPLDYYTDRVRLARRSGLRIGFILGVLVGVTIVALIFSKRH